MGKQFAGSTENAATIILGAERWKKGMKVAGVIHNQFDTKNGLCWTLSLKEPFLDGKEKHTKVAIGNLKGLNMALEDAGLAFMELQRGDAIVIECLGLQTATDPSKNDMVLFKVAVNRP